MVGRDRPEEWVEARRQMSGAANALLSIVGAGATMGILFRKSLGWSLEACILVAIFTGSVVAVAEIFLFGRDVQDAQDVRDIEDDIQDHGDVVHNSVQDVRDSPTA
jgi:hypothetical protein